MTIFYPAPYNKAMNHINKSDCIVVGSGPNGLSAAILLQASGLKTHIIEKSQTPGGGLRSDDALGSNTIRDTCSAVFPMAILSPFFQSLSLEKYGLKWIYPRIPCTHLITAEMCVSLFHSLLETVDQFSSLGERRYRYLFENLNEHAECVAKDVLKPLYQMPRYPTKFLSFGLRAIWPATLIAGYLGDEKARALFAGMAAHSFLPFSKFLSGAAGMVLMLAAHKKGWPLVYGGSGQLSRALIEKFTELGGTIETGCEILDIRELPPHATVFFDGGPQALAHIAEKVLPQSYVNRLRRYQYGPAAYKIDYLLSQPIPWLAKDCREAGTVHLGGSFAHIRNSEQMAWKGQLGKDPFMIVVQPSLFDTSRARPHQDIVWSYAHVPHGYNLPDAVSLMEHHIESFAPGFRDCIRVRKISTADDLNQNNPNLVGGDILGGVADFWQSMARPVLSLNPYATPNPRIYLCSASTPPGAGVHGMCGVWAANAFLKTKQVASAFTY